MAFTLTEVDEIPTRGGVRGVRDSKCLEIVRMVQATAKKKIALTSDSADDLNKFYKSLIQWISRHLDERVNVRKAKETLYVWITPQGEEYTHGRRRRQAAN